MMMTFDLVIGRVAWNHKPANEEERAECQKMWHYKTKKDITASSFFKWVARGDAGGRAR